MKRHGGTVNACYWMKEVNLRMLHAIRFQLYDILEKQNYWRIKDYQELGTGRGESAAHRWFLGQWNDSVARIRQIHIIRHLSKPMHWTPWVNPIVKYGLWVIMTCPCRVISYSKCTTVAWDIDNGEGRVCGGRGYVGNRCALCSVLLWISNCSKK